VKQINFSYGKIFNPLVVLFKNLLTIHYGAKVFIRIPVLLDIRKIQMNDLHRQFDIKSIQIRFKVVLNSIKKSRSVPVPFIKQIKKLIFARSSFLIPP